MSLVDEHLLKVSGYLNEEEKVKWKAITGADSLDIEELKKEYPQSPTLLELLSKVDGTYFREYGEVTVDTLILNSDVGEDFGYYLLSCKQMLKERKYNHSMAEMYGEWLEQDDIISIDPRIDVNVTMDKRLCFAHCMNNGDTSCLYVDFNPTEKGNQAQIIRYLHDPDSYVILADSFEDYLADVVASDYDYVSWDMYSE